MKFGDNIREHFASCKIKYAQKCPICKPYVNGIIEANKALEEKKNE